MNIKIQYAFTHTWEHKLAVVDSELGVSGGSCTDEGVPVTSIADSVQMSLTNQRAFHAVSREGDYVCVIYI